VAELSEVVEKREVCRVLLMLYCHRDPAQRNTGVKMNKWTISCFFTKIPTKSVNGSFSWLHLFSEKYNSLMDNSQC